MKPPSPPFSPLPRVHALRGTRTPVHRKGGLGGIWFGSGKTFRTALLLLAASLSTGCATVGYYSQAIGGHFDLLARARPVDEWLADPALAPEQRTRLAYAIEARAYASRELALPDNDSYRRYADLERPFALWNVFAAPELSVKPREWCFPVVGCVSYRGFFARERAQAYADELRAQGYDVHIAGVAAYSTLGWFDDPLTNAILARPPPEVAGLVFHELAHQRVYARDDTMLNESFATVVELEGVRRWLGQRGEAGQYADYLERRARREAFTRLLLRGHERLERLYAAPATDDEKRAAKQAAFAELRREYAALRRGWPTGLHFDDWMAQDLTNAHLVPAGLYHGQVSALRALLARHGGDLRAFYVEVERLAALSKEARVAALAALPGME
jgi:predicted aminopeptidase